MAEPTANSGSVATKARVTQSDVARVAGVHNTTVSLSLRNCASIPEATRKRIRAIADELGYYPDPTLQALVAYRKGRVAARPKETVAYITNGDSRWGWRSVPAPEQTFLGAQRKAAELGYQLEHFWLGEPGMTPTRLSDILYHRGITGALIAAHQVECAPLAELDWSRLCAIQVGSFPSTPALHRVTSDFGGIIRRALQQTRAAGYDRVGLVMDQSWDDAADQAWSTGYIVEQNRHAAGRQIPALCFGHGRRDWLSGTADGSRPNELADLDRWLRAYRPEVVVGFAPSVLSLLEQLGVAVPRDLAYVDLCVDQPNPLVAGCRQNCEAAGEVAAAMLVGQLQQNHCGLPTVPTTTLVDGTWMAGASLPPVRSASRNGSKLRVPVEAAEPVWLATA